MLACDHAGPPPPRGLDLRHPYMYKTCNMQSTSIAHHTCISCMYTCTHDTASSSIAVCRLCYMYIMYIVLPVYIDSVTVVKYCFILPMYRHLTWCGIGFCCLIFCISSSMVCNIGSIGGKYQLTHYPGSYRILSWGGGGE